MIYLQYAYQKSGLSDPSSIALEIHETDMLSTEVIAEFAAAFPMCKIIPGPVQADLCILVYRHSNSDLQNRINWGRKNMGKMGVGFFSVDRRQFDVIPRVTYSAWARRERQIAFFTKLCGANRAAKYFFRLVDRLLWLKEFY